MQVVKGYVCQTSCDADLAKRNINPADPQDDVHNPKSPNYGKTEDPRNPGKPLPTWESQAVTFGGSLAKTQASGQSQGSSPNSPQSSPQAQKPYTPGSLASVSA